MVHVVQRPRLLTEKPVLDEPTIFACRHVGLMDPVILMVLYYRKMIRPLAALDYFEKNKFTHFFFSHAQCIPIDRHNHSPQWLEDSTAAIRKGESIVIFPEGKRNKVGEDLLPFHVGAALLAARSGARIVPVYNWKWKFPRRYTLAIGEPIRVSAPPGEGTEGFHLYLKAETAKIQAAVAALESVRKDQSLTPKA